MLVAIALEGATYVESRGLKVATNAEILAPTSHNAARHISRKMWSSTSYDGRGFWLCQKRLSRLLCEAWQWKQANGAPRDMVCRGLLLSLHRAGHLALPPARQRGFNPAARYQARSWPAVAVELDTSPLVVPLSTLRPLEFR